MMKEKTMAKRTPKGGSDEAITDEVATDAPVREPMPEVLRTPAPDTAGETRDTAPDPTKGADADEVAPADADADGENADDGRADYRVTAKAGPRYGGRRVMLNNKLRLTAAEAEAGLLSGALAKA